MKRAAIVAAAAPLVSAPSRADDCVPPPGGKCLDSAELGDVKKAVRELDEIHRSPAVLTFQSPVVIVHDWDGRVYVNGGETKPVRVKLKIGDTVDRDLAVTVPVQVYYRPKPPDPVFRLRVRAQIGILPFDLVSTATGDKRRFWDASVGWDLLHFGPVNFSVNTGVASSGVGVGLDLTNNFGVTAAYALSYDGFRSGVFTGAYFSFN